MVGQKGLGTWEVIEEGERGLCKNVELVLN